jgi:hypothetical protein
MLDSMLLGTILAVMLLPATTLTLTLLAVDRRQRAHAAQIAQQIAVTDAIHRELGAVVTPFVTRRPGGRWRVAVAVPFDSPAIVERVVAIAHAAMARSERARGVEIVLSAQDAGVRQANVRKLQPVATSPPGASERGAVAWTGTSTSRAS